MRVRACAYVRVNTWVYVLERIYAFKEGSFSIWYRTQVRHFLQLLILIKCNFTVIIYILCISNFNSLLDTDFQITTVFATLILQLLSPYWPYRLLSKHFVPSQIYKLIFCKLREYYFSQDSMHSNSSWNFKPLELMRTELLVLILLLLLLLLLCTLAFLAVFVIGPKGVLPEY